MLFAVQQPSWLEVPSPASLRTARLHRTLKASCGGQHRTRSCRDRGRAAPQQSDSGLVRESLQEVDAFDGARVGPPNWKARPPLRLSLVASRRSPPRRRER